MNSQFIIIKIIIIVYYAPKVESIALPPAVEIVSEPRATISRCKAIILLPYSVFKIFLNQDRKFRTTFCNLEKKCFKNILLYLQNVCENNTAIQKYVMYVLSSLFTGTNSTALFNCACFIFFQ